MLQNTSVSEEALVHALRRRKSGYACSTQEMLKACWGFLIFSSLPVCWNPAFHAHYTKTVIWSRQSMHQEWFAYSKKPVFVWKPQGGTRKVEIRVGLWTLVSQIYFCGLFSFAEFFPVVCQREDESGLCALRMFYVAASPKSCTYKRLKATMGIALFSTNFSLRYPLPHLVFVMYQVVLDSVTPSVRSASGSRELKAPHCYRWPIIRYNLLRCWTDEPVNLAR